MKIKLFLFALLIPFILNAYTSERALYIKQYKNESKVALIIGNSKYKNFSKLKNTKNDAFDIQTILKKQGFDVIYSEDSSLKQMKKAIRKFTKRLKNGGVGFFYYAGHGIEVDGENYLIPVDAEILAKNEVEFESLSVNFLIKKMEDSNNRLNIVVLDACRNDPFSRSSSGGLAMINNAQGMYIAFATSPGSVASDGRKNERNGLFTKHLIYNIKKPNLELDRVFKNIRRGVKNESNGNQRPWTSSSVDGDFYFNIVKNEEVKKVVYVKKTQSKPEPKKEIPKVNNPNNISDKYGNIYKTVTSPYTKKVWLDRNLGAKRVCTSIDDKECYGDYFQWGRDSDGHEKIGAKESSKLSSIDRPNHSMRIIPSVLNFSEDWRKPSNNKLWQGKAKNNPCPKGFRVPSISELENETIKQGLDTNDDLYASFLKIPSAGHKDTSNLMLYSGSTGYLWSRTGNNKNKKRAKILSFNYDVTIHDYSKVNSIPIRCIKE